MTKSGGSDGEPVISRHTETVKRIRAILGRTQTELATALGISVKAVQSYERGWRQVPTRAMIQLLVLLALYRRQSMDDVPCWKIRECTPEQRKDCDSFNIARGQFCWFVGSKICRPGASKKSDPLLPCMECPVVQRLLVGSGVGRRGENAEVETRDAKDGRYT